VGGRGVFYANINVMCDTISSSVVEDIVTLVGLLGR